jgi:hypothetical protein
MNYGGNGVTVSLPPAKSTTLEAKPGCACNGIGPARKSNAGCTCHGVAHGTARTIKTRTEVDFSKMTAAEKVAYHRARWDRILG